MSPGGKTGSFVWNTPWGSVHRETWLDGANWQTGVGSIPHMTGSTLPRVMSRADIFLNVSWWINLTPGGKTQASFIIRRVKLLTLANTLHCLHTICVWTAWEESTTAAGSAVVSSLSPTMIRDELHSSRILLTEVTVWNEPGRVVVSPPPSSYYYFQSPGPSGVVYSGCTTVTNSD